MTVEPDRDVLYNETIPVGTYLESDGLVVLEAEHFVFSTTAVSHQWQLQTGQSGYTGTGYLQPLPDIDALYQTNEITNSPRVDYPIYFTTPGTYTLWLRGYPANAAGDSVHIGLNGVITTVTGFGPEAWGWRSQTVNSQPFTVAVTGTELYTVSLWLREDGLRLDRLLLTTDTSYVPTGFGPAETGRLTESEALAQALLTRTLVYTYDNLYRLTQASYTSGESYQYNYDEVGNRLEQIINGDTTTYLYDDANRLESVTHLSATQPYTFSPNGNLLATGVMTNSFDAANRLVSSSREGTTVEPIYNGVGDRVGQTIGTSTTHFALDVQGLPEVIYTSEGNVYLHLPGVIVAESSTGETRYLLGDGLGSIRQAVDETGAVVAYNAYDPYGNPVQEGSQPYGFSGEWWQEELGLLHLRARWLMPETGTFLSRDPVESEPPYQYVRGNVVNRIDPSGFTPIWPRIGTTFMYSCRCGWIDWIHARSKGSFIKRIADAAKSTQGDFAWVDTDPRVGGRAVVYVPATKIGSNLPAIALGMFISAENLFEEYIQANSRNPGRVQSSFSNEDLVSDLIGFHRGVETYRFSRDDNTLNDINQLSMKRYMKLCGVVGLEYYDPNQDNSTGIGMLSEFTRIQEAIYFQTRPFPGMGGHKMWGTRPSTQRWRGTVQTRDGCRTLRCTGSEELPTELTSIVPKSPLDSWAWVSGSVPIKHTIGQNEFGVPPFGISLTSPPDKNTLFFNPLSGKFSGGHYFNTLPLNWGASGQ